MKTTNTQKDRPRPEAAVDPSTATPKPRKSGGGTELKTRLETSQALGYSMRTLDRLTKAKVIPHIRTGRLVRYRLDAVLAALQRNCEVKEASA